MNRRNRSTTDPTLRVLGMVLSMCSALSACQTAPVQEVRVPVPVPCIEALPADPDTTPDAVLANLPDAQFVLTLAADRLAWRAYAQAVKAAALACLRR